MANTKGVVGALFALGKTGQAVVLAQCRHLLTAAGKNFVRVALVTHVPHQPIFRRVEDVVQGDGQFDRAQPCREMAASVADRLDQKSAQLIRQGCQLVQRQLPQLIRGRDAFQKWVVLDDHALRGVA